MADRALSFGAVAARYEQFRPGYPAELVDLLEAYAGRPIRTALEIGAGTGKATRVFAGRGVEVTATEPDPAMLAELSKHVPKTVRTEQAAFEDLTTDVRYGLVYAAASMHWTRRKGRWEKVAALLEPGGVFASFGGPAHLRDEAVSAAVHAARLPYLETDNITAGGNELLDSPEFTDVQEAVIARPLVVSAKDYVGLLSTISAYLELADDVQEELYRQILDVLPDQVELNADVTVHLGRKR